jgi:hypothetical protein
MKASRRFLIETAAAGAGAAQESQGQKWDCEAGVVILGTWGAGLMPPITAPDHGADVPVL